MQWNHTKYFDNSIIISVLNNHLSYSASSSSVKADSNTLAAKNKFLCKTSALICPFLSARNTPRNLK